MAGLLLIYIGARVAEAAVKSVNVEAVDILAVAVGEAAAILVEGVVVAW